MDPILPMNLCDLDLRVGTWVFRSAHRLMIVNILLFWKSSPLLYPAPAPAEVDNQS